MAWKHQDFASTAEFLRYLRSKALHARKAKLYDLAAYYETEANDVVSEGYTDAEIERSQSLIAAVLGPDEVRKLEDE